MSDTAKDPDTKDPEDLEYEDVPTLLEQIWEEGHVQVSVYRLVGGKRHFINTVDGTALEGDPLGYIRDRWGGGRYHLQARVDGKIRKSTTQTIAGEPKPIDPEDPEGGPDPDDNLSEKEAEIERLRAELEEREQRERDRRFFEALEGLKDEIVDIREQLRNPPREAEQQNPAEMALSIVGHVQEQTKPYLDALLTEKRAAEPAVDTMMDAFWRGMEAAREMQSGHEYDRVISEVGRPLVEMIGRGMGEGAEQGQPPGAGSPQARGPEPGPPQAAHGGQTGPPPEGQGPAPAQNPDAPMWLRRFQRVIPQLLEWARTGSSPEVRALQILEDVPPQFLEPLADAVRRDDFTGEFSRWVPEARDHTGWFDLFFGKLRDGIDYGDPEGEQPEREPATADPGE